MAKVDPRIETLKKIRKTSNKTEKDLSTRKYDPAKQAEGYKARMDASGVNADEALDKRNIIEKALNLKQDQNVLFDIFEVINRPQQALFGAIDSAQTGDGFLKGLSEGITGNKDTSFGQILRNAGMDDTPIVGEVGWDDVFGFVGDVALDPMDWAVFGASNMVKIAGKSVNYVDALNDAKTSVTKLNTAIQSKKTAQEAAEATLKLKRVKGAKEAKEQAAKLVKELPDAIKADQLELLKQNKIVADLTKMKRSNRNALQVATSAMGSGINKTFTFADSKLTSFLNKIDNVNAERLATQTSQNLLKSTKEVFSYQKYYTDVKSGFRKIFDWTKSFRDQGIDLIGSANKVRGGQMNASAVTSKMWDNLNVDLNKYRDEIFTHFKENGLYDEFLKEAMDGRTMDDLKKIYKGFSDDKIIETVTDVKLQQMAMLNREYGTALFGTPVEIKGLEHKMSLDAMLTDDSLLYNMGVQEEWKNIIEDYVKTYHKNWYDKYFEKGDMFIEYAGNENIVKTYRFNEALDSNEAGEALRSLRSELTRNKQLADLDGTAYKGLRDKYSKALFEKKEMEEFAGNLDALKKAGVAVTPEDYLYIPKDHEKFPEFEAHKKRVKELTIEQEKLKKEIVELGTKGRTKTKIAEITNKVKKITKEAGEVGGKAEAIRIANGTNVAELIQGKKSIIDSTKARFKQVAENQDFSKGIDSYVDFIEASQKARNVFTLPRYISPEKVESVKKFSQSQGFANYMSALHGFLSDSIEAVNHFVGSNYKFQDGFMTHAMTQEWLAKGVKREIGKTEKSVFAASNFIGNTKTFGNRAYRESAMASNEMVKGYIDHLIATKSITDPETISRLTEAKSIKMFQDEANKSMAEFLRKAPKKASDAKMLHQVMKDVVVGSFQDESIIKAVKVVPGEKFVRPKGYTEISKSALIEKLNAMKEFVDVGEVVSGDKTMAKSVAQWLDSLDSEFLLIDNNINRLIGKMGDEHETGVFLKALDAINTVFKRNKLLSIGFPMRNVAGNMSNLYLAGMSMDEIMLYSSKANEVLKKGDGIFKSVPDTVYNAFTEAQKKEYTEYMEFMANGFSQVGNRIHDLGDDLKVIHKGERHKLDPRRVYDKIVEMNGKINERQDATYRMAAYLWAKKNPDRILELGFDAPEKFVRNALFDFTDLSVTEQDVLRKVIPFYTFTKKNLGFQARNMMQNPQRYNRLMKAFDSTWDLMDLSDEEIDAYSVENFWIPIPIKGEDGKYYTIKSSLPLGDMGEWLSDPFRRLMSSTSPAIRAPFEVATNTQTFSGMPIEEFKGQKGFQIPELSRGTEYALGLTGLDVPIGVGADAIRAVGNAAKGNVGSVAQFADEAFGRGLLNQKDPAKIAERKAYDELDTLETLMRYYKQENVDIMTMAEINLKNQKSNTQAIINNLRAITKRGY